MTETNDTTGFWISPVTFAVNNLSWAEKILIEKINSLDNDDRGCYASNKYLGDFLGVKNNTMANMLSDLVKRGFLIRVFFDGHNRGYRSVMHHPELSLKNEGSQEPSQKSEGNRHEKVIVQSEPSQINEGLPVEPSLINENEPSQKSEENNRDKEEEYGSGLNRHVREVELTTAVFTPNIPKESQDDYLKRKQLEYPQFDVYDIFKDFSEKCRSPQYPKLRPTREQFDKWLATQHQPMVLPKKTNFVNPTTGKGLK